MEPLNIESYGAIWSNRDLGFNGAIGSNEPMELLDPVRPLKVPLDSLKH